MKMFALLLLLALGGCVGTAAHIVTAPVRVAGWGVDKLTTSRREADEARGRRDRKADERRAKEARKAARAQREAAERDRRHGSGDRPSAEILPKP